MNEAQKGFLALIGASMIWGLGPIFYKVLSHVPPQEVLAHRALWSFVFFGGILALQGRLGEIKRAFSDRRQAIILAVAGLVISVNWFLFILAVQIGKTTETSLGYYIYPLVAVVAGRVLFGERLGRVQWLAVALVSFAVGLLTWGLGVAPWMSLVLALTFTLYGIIKKQLALGPVVSVTCEIMVFLPIALVLLAMAHSGGQGAFGKSTLDSVLLVAAGPVTAFPLILFSFGIRRITMSTTGLLLYINPTLQFLCAVLLFHEPFTRWHGVSFAIIWLALVLYSVAAIIQDKAARKASMAASGVSTTVRKLANPGSANP